MARFLITGAFLFVASAPVLAQDMPLSQILIAGEGWKKVDGNPAQPEGLANLREGFTAPGAVIELMAVRPDRATVYQWRSGDAMVSAAPVAGWNNGKPEFEAPFAPYCPLRVARGEKLPRVTGLVFDRDARLYAVSDVGIQVFDPTGRLCGVMTAPQGAGPALYPRFEGDQLTLWIGEVKYTRKLNTAAK